MRLTMFPIAIVLALAACDGPAGPDRTFPIDAAAADASASDASSVDAAAVDASDSDASEDASEIDAPATADAGPIDAPPATDAGPVDAPPAADAGPIDAPTMTPPVLLRLSLTGGDAHIAMNAAGDAAAIWCEADHVIARHYVKGVGWQTQTQLDPAHCWQNRIAMTSTGDVVAVWLGLGTGLWTARYTVAAGWGAPVQLDGPATAASVQPTVAVDAAGNAFVLWVQGTWPNAIRLWARRYAAGVWEPSLLIDEQPAAGGGLADLQLGFDASGVALLLWRVSTDTASGIDEQLWSRRFVAATGWGPAQQIPGHTGAIVADNLLVRTDGTAYAVWTFIGGSSGPVYNEQSWFTPGVGWTTAERVATEASGEPTATLDGSGNVVVAWNTTGDITHARRYTAPGTSADAVVGPGGFTPILARVPSDGLVLAWTQGVFLDQLWARRCTWGNWGTPIRVDAIDGVIAGWQITGSPSGDSAAIWSQSDGPPQQHGGTWGIWAAVW